MYNQIKKYFSFEEPVGRCFDTPMTAKKREETIITSYKKTNLTQETKNFLFDIGCGAALRLYDGKYHYVGFIPYWYGIGVAEEYKIIVFGIDSNRRKFEGRITVSLEWDELDIFRITNVPYEKNCLKKAIAWLAYRSRHMERPCWYEKPRMPIEYGDGDPVRWMSEEREISIY